MKLGTQHTLETKLRISKSRMEHGKSRTPTYRSWGGS